MPPAYADSAQNPFSRDPLQPEFILHGVAARILTGHPPTDSRWVRWASTTRSERTVNPQQEPPWDGAEQSWVLLAAGGGGEQGQEMEAPWVLLSYFPHPTKPAQGRQDFTHGLRGFSPWSSGPMCMDRKQSKRNTGKG